MKKKNQMRKLQLSRNAGCLPMIGGACDVGCAKVTEGIRNDGIDRKPAAGASCENFRN
jgi:hypothetical protein